MQKRNAELVALLGADFRSIADTPRQTNADKTIYISATGSDATGRGISSLPYASLSYVWNTVIPFVVAHDIVIQFADGTYTLGDHVILEGKTGPGSIIIQGNTGDIDGVTLRGQDTYSVLLMRGIQLQSVLIQYMLVKESLPSGIAIERCSGYVEVSNVILIETNGPGFSAWHNSTAYVHNCNISGNTIGIKAFDGANIHSDTNVSNTTYTATANNSQYGLQAGNHGEITKSSTQPSGTISAENTAKGGSIA